MTFRGNLLLYSLWYELHPFENLRRKGHHCHGLTHLSWAERKIFYRVLGKKFGNDSNLLIVFYVQIMPDDFVMQLHRF